MPRLPWFRLTLPYPHSWKVGECTCKALESGGELGWPVYLWDSMSSSSPTLWVASSALHLQLISLCLGNRVDMTISSKALFESVKQFADRLIFLGGILYDFVGARLGNYWSLIFTELKVRKFDTSVPHEIRCLSTSPFWGEISIPSISEAWPPPVPNLRGYAPATPISKGMEER